MLRGSHHLTSNRPGAQDFSLSLTVCLPAGSNSSSPAERGSFRGRSPWRKRGPLMSPKQKSAAPSETPEQAEERRTCARLCEKAEKLGVRLPTALCLRDKRPRCCSSQLLRMQAAPFISRNVFMGLYRSDTPFLELNTASLLHHTPGPSLLNLCLVNAFSLLSTHCLPFQPLGGTDALQD